MIHLLGSWQFWAILAAIFAALTAVFAKVGVESLDPDLATFIRTLVVVFLLAAIVWFRDKGSELRGIGASTGLFLILSGIATGASWLCYFRALKLGDASRVAPVDKLSVVFVAVLSALLLGESLSSLGWLGVVLIATGSMLIAIS